jgi:hypothetical protein
MHAENTSGVVKTPDRSEPGSGETSMTKP